MVDSVDSFNSRRNLSNTVNSLEHSHCWEDNRPSANQEISHISCNPKVHYRISQAPANFPYPEPEQSSSCPPPHHTFWTPFLILSFHLRNGLPSGFLPSGIHTKTLYALVLSLIRATCPWRLTLRDLTTQIAANIIWGPRYLQCLYSASV